MTERNRTYLSVKEDPQASWTFAVPASAETCSEATVEMTSICRALFSAFEGFLKPLEIQLKAPLFEEDRSISSIDRDWNPVDVVERTVEDDSGIAVHEFVESTPSVNHGIPLLRRVEFRRIAMNVLLESGPQYVDRTSGCKLYRGSELQDRDPDFDPVRISVRQATNHEEASIEAAFLYYVTIEVYADFVFFDTNLAEENRKRLGDFLERFVRNTGVESIRREPDEDTVHDVF